MPQSAKGIRLYLRKRKGQPAIWIIRDGPRQIGTGAIGARNREAAQEALAGYILNRTKFNVSESSPARVPVEDVLNHYGRTHAPKTAHPELVGYHMSALLPFWAGKSLSDVRTSTCDAYVAMRMKMGRKAATARRELKTLQAAINVWHRESPLDAVPRVTLPRADERRERVLERSEAAALLRAARRLKYHHVARFILIGLYTGTRHNAILQLRWMPSISGGHVDLERGVLYRRGAGERESSKRRPPCSLPVQLARHLQRWHRDDIHSVRAAHIIHYRGGSILKLRKSFAAVVREAGLGPDVTPHVLRHTCCSWLLWKGVSIWDVAGVVGASPSTIERVYAHHQLQVKERKRA